MGRARGVGARARRSSAGHRTQWLAALGTALGGVAAILTLLFTVLLDSGDSGGGGSTPEPVAQPPSTSTVTVEEVRLGSPGHLDVVGRVGLARGRVYVPMAEDSDESISYLPGQMAVYVVAETQSGRFVSDEGGVGENGSWKVALDVEPLGLERPYVLNPGLFAPAGPVFATPAGECPPTCGPSRSEEDVLTDRGAAAFDVRGKAYRPNDGDKLAE
ncbi:MAG: hypothetical protein ACRDZ1_06430 [Acidimicrobiia bacterium]